jgi:hypothetical protein
MTLFTTAAQYNPQTAVRSLDQPIRDGLLWSLIGRAFVQNLRRGDYELAIEHPDKDRVHIGFDELALSLRRHADKRPV